MSGQPSSEPLLVYIRIVAAVVTTVLFVIVVIDQRDATTIGLVFGALAVLLGLAGVDAVKERMK